MTIRVTITNDNDPTSIAEAKIIQVIGGAGDKHLLAPGKSAQTHVWNGTQITITEVEEAKPERRGNRDTGYGALPPSFHD